MHCRRFVLLGLMLSLFGACRGKPKANERPRALPEREAGSLQHDTFGRLLRGALDDEIEIWMPDVLRRWGATSYPAQGVQRAFSSEGFPTPTAGTFSELIPRAEADPLAFSALSALTAPVEATSGAPGVVGHREVRFRSSITHENRERRTSLADGNHYSVGFVSFLRFSDDEAAATAQRNLAVRVALRTESSTIRDVACAEHPSAGPLSWMHFGAYLVVCAGPISVSELEGGTVWNPSATCTESREWVRANAERLPNGL
jgi:hypothetical protein